MMIRKIKDWFASHRLHCAVIATVLAALAMGSIAVSDLVCRSASRGRIFRSVEDVSENGVALVLGTGKTTTSGRPNLHFSRRIKAAAELYHAGKVRHLLVSGDNHVATYDEPTDMREALMNAGVPEEAITCDYAGFRTLDSVIRAKLVFGLSRFTIVTEEFHCPRALWVARHHRLDAIAFAAPDLNFRWSARVKAREYLARVNCSLDLYVLHRGPRFPGPPEPIQLSLTTP